MSPKVEQNRKPKVFEIYWEKTNLVFPPPFLEGQHSVPNFETGLQKPSAWWDLKSLFNRYLPGGLLCFFSKKTVK